MGPRPTRVNENQRRKVARCDFQEPKATKDLRSLLKEQLRGILRFAQNDRVHLFFRSLFSPAAPDNPTDWGFRP